MQISGDKLLAIVVEVSCGGYTCKRSWHIDETESTE